MTQSMSSIQQFRGINRTICIGLGGTGLDIIMRVRRSIVNRYGDLKNLPIVSFVHIDTDKSADQASNLRTGNIHHGVDLSLRESEKVRATMSAIEVENFRTGLEKRSNYERQGPYDHIRLWFPLGLSGNIKAIEDGAKAIRPVGRLAFFHNYRAIKTAIDNAERLTRGHNAKLLRLGLKVDEQLNIFVLGSLCGGTGSGMFLDLAYSLRNDYSNQGAQIVGYLIIAPNLYTGSANPNPAIFANTYAALKELNYYNTPGTKFQACYDMQNLVMVAQERPPFDYTYLVGERTKDGYQIADKRKLCNVIAHKIALDFSGELAPVVKGQRDNFAQHLLEWDNHPRPHVQRYLTFGLAAIYFPRDLIVRIALTRINQNLCFFWLYGVGQNPDPQQLLEQFLIQERWYTDLNQREGFTWRLGAMPQEVNKTFSQTLSNWRTKLEGLISECQSRDDRINLRQQLSREFREQFRRVQPGETESTRGIWLTKVQQIRPNLTQELKANIDQFIEALLTPNNPNFSIKSCRDWLDAFLTDLINHQSRLEEKIQSFAGMNSIEQIEKKWRNTEQIIEEIEEKFTLPVIGMNKNNEIQSEAKKMIRQANDLIKHNFDLVVTQESLQIVKELQQYVQEWSTQMASFSRLVDNINSNYQRDEQHWKQLDADEMSGEAIFDEQDIESCYKELLPEREYRDQLVIISKEMAESSGRNPSLISFVERSVFGGTYAEQMTQEKIQQDISLTVDRLFGSRSLRIVKSVIKRFLDNYKIPERSIRLGDIIKEAEPLLPINLRDPHFRDTPAKRSQMIGFKNTDDEEVQDFKSLLVRDLAKPDNILKQTQSEDEILLLTEYAGFPLRLIQGLEDMQKHYLRERNVTQAYLHNDSPEKFIDIIPPDIQTIEKLEDIFYPCLAFELLHENPQTKQLEFQHYDGMRDVYYTASLSQIWNQSLEILAQRPDITQVLEELLQQAESEIDNQPDRWESYYLPKLREFVKQVDNLPENHPNYPYKATVVGTPGTSDTLAKEGIIIRLQQRIKERVKTLQSDQKLTNITPNSQKVLSSNPEIMDVEPEELTQNNFARNHLKELERLVAMYEKSLLTDEEFQAAKRKLLGL